MAALHREQHAQHWIVRCLPLTTLGDAQNLARRYQEGKALRLYVRERIRLVVPVILLMVLIGVACAVAPIVYLGDVHPLLALPALLLVPVVLIGGLFVQAYVFFSWLDGRALARALGHRRRQTPGPVAAWLSKRAGLDLGSSPPVPWILAAVVLFAPLAMLASFAWKFSLLLVVLAALTPFVYARFDRQRF